MKDVIVIGGGASGMIAGIEAAKKGKKVLIIEKNNKLGNKIYATGNGKCNLANSHIDKDSFRGDNIEFYNQIITCFDYKKIVEYFEEIGLYTTITKNNLIYPASKQASSVVNVLVKLIDYLRIEVAINTEVIDVKKVGNEYICITNDAEIKTKNIIISTGGLSSIKNGNKNPYEWARKFNHKIIPTYPALVPLLANKPLNFNKIGGVRVATRADLYINNEKKYTQIGEIQLRDYGLSGIMIFSLSRYAVKALNDNEKVHIICDFAYEFCNINDVINIIFSCPYLTLIDLYSGFIDRKLAYEIIKTAGFTPEIKAVKLKKADLEKIDKNIHSMNIPIIGYKNFLDSQVTLGGVDTTQIYPNSMESKLIKGLYFTGEVLDMDGDCGGYNLMWAWATGYIAGNSIK